MKVSSIDFFGVIVTYRVEARKAGPTVFLSLRSSVGCTSMVQDAFAMNTRDIFSAHLMQLDWRSMCAHWFPSASSGPLTRLQGKGVRCGKICTEITAGRVDRGGL